MDAQTGSQTYKVHGDLSPSGNHLTQRPTSQVHLNITREEVGDGERWEDGEGVRGEERGGGVHGEIFSLDTDTEPVE